MTKVIQFNKKRIEKGAKRKHFYETEVKDGWIIKKCPLCGRKKRFGLKDGKSQTLKQGDFFADHNSNFDSEFNISGR